MREISPRWGRPEPAWRLLAPPVTAAARAVFDIRAHGVEQIPRQGPALLVANHVGHLDPLVLFTAVHRAVGRRVRFLALADLFDDAFVGWWLRRARAIPVRRGGGLDPIVEAAGDALDHGEVVLVYPEGRLPRRRPLSARPGAGAIALSTRAPIIPVAVWGMQADLPGRPLRRPAAVEVGAPLPPAELTGDDPGAVSAALLSVVRGQLLPRAKLACGFPADYPDVDPARMLTPTGSTWRTTLAIVSRFVGGG